MTADRVYYDRIAKAEQAIIDAGYMRDSQRHQWVNWKGQTTKVMREEPGKFYVEWP
jgi:hypothetical protein